MLAKQLVEPLSAIFLSYDNDIWSKYKPTLPKDISKADEWDVVEAKARVHIDKLLKSGQSVIFDDLSVEVEDRNMLREVASKNNAKAIVIFMDTPAEEVIRRQKQNEETQERGLTSDGNMELVMSQLQYPLETENVIIVKPGYVIATILSDIESRLK